MKKPKKAKKEKIVVFESEMNLAPPIFSDVEREIIMADIAFLKQKEKESGDWDKWLEHQKDMERPGLSAYIADDPYENEPRIRRMESNYTYTRERFIQATGREPVGDELDRANCVAAGTTGHWGCGWCAQCDKPIFCCQHFIRI